MKTSKRKSGSGHSQPSMDRGDKKSETKISDGEHRLSSEKDKTENSEKKISQISITDKSQVDEKHKSISSEKEMPESLHRTVSQLSVLAKHDSDLEKTQSVEKQGSESSEKEKPLGEGVDSKEAVGEGDNIQNVEKEQIEGVEEEAKHREEGETESIRAASGSQHSRVESIYSAASDFGEYQGYARESTQLEGSASVYSQEQSGSESWAEQKEESRLTQDGQARVSEGQQKEEAVIIEEVGVPKSPSKGQVSIDGDKFTQYTQPSSYFDGLATPSQTSKLLTSSMTPHLIRKEAKGEIYEEEDEGVKKISSAYGDDGFVEEEEDEEDSSRKYLQIEATVLDDMGREVLIKQRVPIIRQVHEFVRKSIPAEEEDIGSLDSRQHIYIERVKQTIRKYQLTPDGREEADEEDIEAIVGESRRRPPPGQPVFYKKIEDGVEIEVMVDWEREAAEEEQEIMRILEEKVKIRNEERKKRLDKIAALKQLSPKKTVVHKFVKTMRTKEVSPGVFQEVPGVSVEEIIEEVPEEEEEEVIEEIEDYSEEDLAEEEKEIKKSKYENAMRKMDLILEEKLKKILITLSLEKRKQAKLTKLILIATEMNEKSAAKTPTRYSKRKSFPQNKGPGGTEVRSGRSREEEMKKLYLEKMMEYRELRSAFLVKLAMEKKKIEETKQVYDDLTHKLQTMRQEFTDKLSSAITRLKPRDNDVFRFQSPEAIVRRVTDLEKRVFEVRKTILEKDKKLSQFKKELEEAKGGEEGTCFKYDLLNKELFSTNNKNDRREAKLESLKQCIQKHSQTLAHINQKLSAVMRANNQKCDQLEKLQEFLTQKRFERQGIHASKNEMEMILQKTLDKFKSEDYPLLMREFELIQDDMKEKKAHLEELKATYKEKIKNYSSRNNSSPRINFSF